MDKVSLLSMTTISDLVNKNNAGCLFSASFDHRKTLSALLTIFTLLSFHQFKSILCKRKGLGGLYN